MNSINVTMAILTAIIASAYLVRLLRFALPLPLVQVVLGVVISAVFEQGVKLDPEVFFLLFLPPLLFLDGWRIPKHDLFRDKAVILELALGLVIFTVVGAGFLIHWLIPSMPLAVAFALAAIVSPTDPVAVTSIASRVPLPKRLMHILEGESLLNDATGLVCFRFAVAAAITGTFSLGSASLTFLWLAIVGLGVGIGFTMAVSFGVNWLSRQLGKESRSQILISLLIPFGAYLCAEHLHASGILAAVAAGITVSYIEPKSRTDPIMRIQGESVWDTVQFALNGAMFVLLGEQLPAIVSDILKFENSEMLVGPWQLGLYAVSISVGLVVLRFIWVWTSLHLTLLLFRKRRSGQLIASPPLQLVLATSLAGVRGAITLAGVMSLPLVMPDGAPFPARELTVFLASAVILISLLTASVFLPLLLKNLELPEESEDQVKADKAIRAAATAAISAIEKHKHAPEDAEIYAYTAARIIEEYRDLTDDETLGNREPEEIQRADAAERKLRIVALQAERAEIFRLARHAEISDETSRRLVRKIDLQESRYA